MNNMEEQNDLMKMENFLNNKEKINTDDKNYERIMFLYDSALKSLKTKIDILIDEQMCFYNYKPIEYVVTRRKNTESIIKKLNKKKYELTYGNMIERINDIAGMRIVCNFKDDIYKIIEEIESFHDIRILNRKDYIKKPKKSGYMSYHMIVEVPVNFSKGIVYVKVEIQLRTMGMDFWAGLEHKINYKNTNQTKKQTKEFVKYSKIINNIDSKMCILMNENLECEKEVAKTIDTSSVIMT